MCIAYESAPLRSPVMTPQASSPSRCADQSPHNCEWWVREPKWTKHRIAKRVPRSTGQTVTIKFPTIVNKISRMDGGWCSGCTFNFKLFRRSEETRSIRTSVSALLGLTARKNCLAFRHLFPSYAIVPFYCSHAIRS